MLSAADASLVAREPMIRGMSAVLDEDAFAAVLHRLYPDAGVTGAVSRYVRYKPGTSCLVGYRVRCGAGELDVYARVHHPDLADRVDEAATTPGVVSRLGGGIRVDRETEVVVYPFPNDRALPALARFANDAERRAMLSSLLPDHPDLWEGTVEPLRYKPERRFVAHLQREGHGGAVLRFFRRDDYAITSRQAGAFESEPPLRIAPRLNRDSTHRAAAVEWLEGRTLYDSMVSGTVTDADLERVGAALARLHGQGPRLRGACTAAGYVEALSETIVSVTEVAPDLAGRARDVAARVAAEIQERRWRDHAVHGDFSAEQVLLQNGEVAILDFDRAGYGDPRIDLGTFRARLEHDVVRGAIDGDRADAMHGLFLEAYRRHVRKDRSRHLRPFVAASLLRFAVEPFRTRLDDWSAEEVMAGDRIDA
jgi:tRNA A-37 threonylcarbamoyl transferase component Bud32